MPQVGTEGQTLGAQFYIKVYLQVFAVSSVNIWRAYCGIFRVSVQFDQADDPIALQGHHKFAQHLEKTAW